MGMYLTDVLKRNLFLTILLSNFRRIASPRNSSKMALDSKRYIFTSGGGAVGWSLIRSWFACLWFFSARLSVFRLSICDHGQGQMMDFIW